MTPSAPSLLSSLFALCVVVAAAVAALRGALRDGPGLAFIALFAGWMLLS